MDPASAASDRGTVDALIVAPWTQPALILGPPTQPAFILAPWTQPAQIIALWTQPALILALWTQPVLGPRIPAGRHNTPRSSLKDNKNILCSSRLHTTAVHSFLRMLCTLYFVPLIHSIQFLSRSISIIFRSIDSGTAGIKIVIIYFNIFISFAFPSLHDYVLAPYSRI